MLQLLTEITGLLFLTEWSVQRIVSIIPSLPLSITETNETLQLPPRFGRVFPAEHKMICCGLTEDRLEGV